VTDLNNVDSLIIRPSHNSEDVMALVSDSGYEVIVLYRQK